MAATLKGKSGELNIVIEQGATFSLPATWRDEDGTPVDLTGCTAQMHIRQSKTSPSTIHELTDVSGIALGGTAGTVVATIDAATTAGFSFSEGYYDLEIVHPDTSVTRLLRGKVELDTEVTK